MAQPLAGAVLACFEIAGALEETARETADAVENAEHLTAMLPPTPGITYELRKLKRRAELLGVAHAYFKEMAEHPETPVVFDRMVYGVAVPVTKP